MSKKNAETALNSEYIERIVDSGGVLAEKAGMSLTYSKRQFLNSEKYKKHRDLINVLLENNKFYSKTEDNKLIDNYLKGKVR